MYAQRGIRGSSSKFGTWEGRRLGRQRVLDGRAGRRFNFAC